MSNAIIRIPLDCVDCGVRFYSVRGKQSMRTRLPTLCEDCRFKKQRDVFAKHNKPKTWPAKRSPKS